MTDQSADRTATPVKQRADCTETEWAEQERARFERLYTRETVRADTAARDADIYQRRLERLGEGYTRERKRAEKAEADANHNADLVAAAVQRAEQAEAEAERLRTDRAAACICGHAEAQHFEDACLVCDCGDYLVAEAAREVIARWRAAATRAPADRAATEERAARWETAALKAGREVDRNALRVYMAVADAEQAELRRMAVEARQPSLAVEDCTCIPFTRQGGVQRYCQPGDTVDMISGWEIGGDCPHHRDTVKAQPEQTAIEARFAALKECICTPDACPPHCPCHADEQPAVGAQQPKEARS